jgi:hypothetical protein
VLKLFSSLLKRNKQMLKYFSSLLKTLRTVPKYFTSRLRFIKTGSGFAKKQWIGKFSGK